MINIIFQKLFSRKWELLILGVIVIVCALGSKIIAIEHWYTLGFDVTGYSPWAGIIALIWSSAGMGVLLLRRIRAPSLYIMFGAGIIYSLILIWMVNLQ